MTARDKKPCTSCGTAEWYSSGNCKVCSRRAAQAWKSRNQKRSKEITAEWRENNRERMYEHNRQWAEKNPEVIAKAKRDWRKKYPEKQRTATRRWAKENPEAVSAKVHRYRARKISNGGSYTSGEWRELCAEYGNTCAVPGCERTDLEPDHVIPISKGGCNNIGNIQPLCVWHNRSKSNKVIDYRRKQ